MEVQYTATAYLGEYSTIEEVANGRSMPILIDGDGNSYFDSQGYTKIGKATVAIQLFSDDEITRNKLDALKAELQTVRADNQRRENAILERISKLQAITYTAEA